jgi:hypothetical protein
MATLLSISTPGGLLTYQDGDVVCGLDAAQSPGRAVEANPNGHWSFVYVTDREHTHADITSLVEPDSTTDPDTQEEIFNGKRRRYITLPGDASQYQTYTAYDEAPAAMKMTWAELSALITDRQA